MGNNQCCTTQNVSSTPIERMQSQISLQILHSDYYLHDWPLEETVQLKINYFKQQQEYQDIFNKHKVMKHKFLDKYYIGDWNDKGAPEGKGIMLQPDILIYCGNFHTVPDGHGVVEFFRERIRYEGEIKEGKAQGQGKITSLDDKYSFEGIMSNSNPKTGKIILKNPHDQTKTHTIILDNFPTNKSEIVYGDGRKYYGFINKRSYAPQGEGTAVFSDNSKYDGNWEEGEMHGHGAFLWNDGSSYNGEYQHSRKHGIGTFTFVSKKYYQGQWAHGKQNGKGTLFDKNGTVIQKGIWKDGVLQKQTQ